MKILENFVCIVLLLFVHNANAQKCRSLGQNPETAFPVCGQLVFNQTQVPVCGNKEVQSNCTSSQFSYLDKNPFWYQFTCYETGSLGFKITPQNLSDDYDWQIFDITEQAPQAVYTDPSLFVACNWSGDPGITGASTSGNSLVVCGGEGKALYTTMPMLTKGHTYLLMISHFDGSSQSGYSLEFSGGTANITDNTKLNVKAVTTSCNAKTLFIKLNKKIQCNSISKNGTELSITPSNSSIAKIEGAKCFESFGTDSIVVSFNDPLPEGNYTLAIGKGDDGNTLLDVCNNEMPPLTILFSSQTSAAPLPVSIDVPGCSPSEITVALNNPVNSNSIAPNGSDFIVSGAMHPVTIVKAEAVNNAEATTTSIKLKFLNPVNDAGDYVLKIVQGSDGNTLVSDCNMQVPANTSLNFSTKNNVSAKFNHQIKAGCTQDTVYFFAEDDNNSSSYLWKFNNMQSSLQNPFTIYHTAGEKKITLTVSNDFCADKDSTTIFLEEKPKADFQLPSTICRSEQASVTNNSTGNIVSWQWNWGNGLKDFMQQSITPVYPYNPQTQTYPVTLIITNNKGCGDTATKLLQVISNCNIAVPGAFTPNNDKLNDYFYPLNAMHLPNLVFRVYNRLGQLIFEGRNAFAKWDGRYNGTLQNTGTYIWAIEYYHPASNKKINLKGTVLLIR